MPSTPDLASVTSTALEASHVIKAGPGKLYILTVYNDKASAQYIQVHDTTSVPADTAVPALTFQVATKATLQLTYSPFGKTFSTGIVVCNSSTGGTKTLGSADCWFDVQYG